MRLHLIDAAEGDSLLLESADTQPRYALIDGGPTGNFARNVQPYLEQTLGSTGKLDVVMVSHVDADHIAGILDLFAELERAAVDGEQRLHIADLWHNSFSATIDNSEGTLQGNLQSLMTMAGRAQVASPFGAVALLGINQGAQLRRLALKLSKQVN